MRLNQHTHKKNNYFVSGNNEIYCSLRPGLFDFNAIAQSSTRTRLDNSFKMAEKHFGVPRYLDSTGLWCFLKVPGGPFLLVSSFCAKLAIWNRRGDMDHFAAKFERKAWSNPRGFESYKKNKQTNKKRLKFYTSCHTRDAMNFIVT